MPGGRNTRKHSGRSRGAVESRGKRLRLSKGTDEVVEILQFGNGNHGDPDLQPQIHMRKVMQSNQHVLQTLTLAIILVQISWTLTKLSGIRSFRCKHLADPKHPKLAQMSSLFPATPKSRSTWPGGRKPFVWGERTCLHMYLCNCQKIWAHQHINIALLLKGNVELQDLCLGGILHIMDKGQL